MINKKTQTKIIGVIMLALLFSVMPFNYIKASENKAYQFDFKKSFNYLYIDHAEQAEGEQQSIVLSFKDDMSQVSGMELLTKDESGRIKVVQMTKNEEGVFLFQEEFEKGVHHIEGIRMTENGKETIYLMEEMEIDAYFGVGTECFDDAKSEHVKMQSMEDGGNETTTQVIVLDEEGSISVKEGIADAIEEADANNGNNARTVMQEIVVVLDPGHDSTHTGASGNGVNEHVATLKIAKYCKEELETYGGVAVYLTRTNSDCPFPDSENNIDDIKQRVKWASQKGADVYVSIHLNAAESTSAKGAEVYYHSESTEGKNISQKVQNELVELGLYDRSIKSNDNYAVTKTAQSYGFPGIIIEHGFLTNSNDAEKYLKTNEGLKKLGVADAEGIAEYFGLSKTGAKMTMDEAVYTIMNASDNTSVLSVVEEKNEYEETIKRIRMNPHEQLSTQRFELLSAGDKYYYIVTEQSGNAMGISDGTVKLEELQEGNINQKWAFLSDGNGDYYLRSESGKYLAYSDGEVLVTDMINDMSQTWAVKRASYRSIEGVMLQLVSVKKSDENVVVKWKELTGAEGYYVYRKIEDAEWKKIATVKSETKTSYEDTSAPSKTECSYTVKAYKGETESLYNETGLSITTPEKKTYVKYKTTTEVNYRTGPGTSYSKAGTLASGKVISVEKGYSKTANGHKWYRFKLDSKNYYIASEYLKIYIAKPKLVSATYKGGKVTVEWKKVTNAKGYYIYRKTGENSYSKVATVKSGSKETYVDDTVKAGKKYIYTVRAYNGKVKSSYNKTGVSVKIPAKKTYVKYKTTAKVNYRTGPGTSYGKVGTLSKGTVIKVEKGYSKTANGYKWYRFKKDSKNYYVAAKYLKKQ